MSGQTTESPPNPKSKPPTQLLGVQSSPRSWHFGGRCFCDAPDAHSKLAANTQVSLLVVWSGLLVRKDPLTLYKPPSRGKLIHVPLRTWKNTDGLCGCCSLGPNHALHLFSTGASQLADGRWPRVFGCTPHSLPGSTQPKSQGAKRRVWNGWPSQSPSRLMPYRLFSRNKESPLIFSI